MDCKWFNLSARCGVEILLALVERDRGREGEGGREREWGNYRKERNSLADRHPTAARALDRALERHERVCVCVCVCTRVRGFAVVIAKPGGLGLHITTNQHVPDNLGPFVIKWKWEACASAAIASLWMRCCLWSERILLKMKVLVLFIPLPLGADWLNGELWGRLATQ